jgi:hypothetical protein
MMERAKTFEKEKNVKGGDYAKPRNTQSNTQSTTAVFPFFFFFSFGKRGETEKKQKTKKRKPRTPLETSQGGRGWWCVLLCFGLSLDEWEGKELLVH